MPKYSPLAPKNTPAISKILDEQNQNRKKNEKPKKGKKGGGLTKEHTGNKKE